jgi:integrase/recombinase XerD
MHVQRVAMPASRTGSWTVLGDDDAPVEPIERFLAYLSDIERSPHTVRAYAHDLRDYWAFLSHRGLDWREVRLEDLGEFVAWLRLPAACRVPELGHSPDLRLYAARSYSLIRPPRTGRRLICWRSRSGEGWLGRGGRSRSAR